MVISRKHDSWDMSKAKKDRRLYFQERFNNILFITEYFNAIIDTETLDVWHLTYRQVCDLVSFGKFW